MRENKIKLFISYAWEDEGHQSKVADFVSALRMFPLEVIYDQNLRLGDRLPDFMEQAVYNCDYVLMICTPNYKTRADKLVGGVGFENKMIKGDLFSRNNERKYIPILFSGSWKESIPNWAKGKLGVDLSRSEARKYEMIKLLRCIIDGFDVDDGNVGNGASPGEYESMATELMNEWNKHSQRPGIFEILQNPWTPMYSPIEGAAEFFDKQDRGETSSSEDIFGF